jgi:hypothetical protein
VLRRCSGGAQAVLRRCSGGAQASPFRLPASNLREREEKNNRGRQLLQYWCDWCGRQKKPHESWIVGLAVERRGVTGNRRQFETLEKWSAKWAAHPLAVHLCSEKHKDKYVDALFTSPWPSVSKTAIAKAAFLRRNEQRSRKEKSDVVAEWYIEKEDSSALRQRELANAQKRKRRRHAEKVPTDPFTEMDNLHARSFGILLDPPNQPNGGGSEM